MEHPVWEILNKDIWTEDGAKNIEHIYDATERIFKDATPEDIKLFCEGLNYYDTSTFYIVNSMRK